MRKFVIYMFCAVTVSVCAMQMDGGGQRSEGNHVTNFRELTEEDIYELNKEDLSRMEELAVNLLNSPEEASIEKLEIAYYRIGILGSVSKI
jgi:hypothetical protein